MRLLPLDDGTALLALRLFVTGMSDPTGGYVQRVK
jgi:hypothetical protein